MVDCPYREEEPGGAASPEEAPRTRERKEIETEEDKVREQREEQAPLLPTEDSVERAEAQIGYNVNEAILVALGETV